MEIFESITLNNEDKNNYYMYLYNIIKKPNNIDLREIITIIERAFKISIRNESESHLHWNKTNVYYKSLAEHLCFNSLDIPYISYCSHYLQTTKNKIIYNGMSLYIKQKFSSELKVFERERIKYFIETYFNETISMHEQEMHNSIRDESALLNEQQLGEEY